MDHFHGCFFLSVILLLGVSLIFFILQLGEVLFSLQSNHLVSITSNIWGTKFRFSGLTPFLPNELGSVTYKTSLLHLQPRQMTVGIIELSSDLHTQPNDPECNAGNLSESEDEHYGERIMLNDTITPVISNVLGEWRR